MTSHDILSYIFLQTYDIFQPFWFDISMYILSGVDFRSMMQKKEKEKMTCSADTYSLIHMNTYTHRHIHKDTYT